MRVAMHDVIRAINAQNAPHVSCVQQRMIGERTHVNPRTQRQQLGVVRPGDPLMNEEIHRQLGTIRASSKVEEPCLNAAWVQNAKDMKDAHGDGLR